MLIRWAAAGDKPAWIGLTGDAAGGFDDPDTPPGASFHEYIESGTGKYEALIAVDRMSGLCLGVIGFSRRRNRITWFGVREEKRGQGIGSRLLMTALRQLDTGREITVVTFGDGYAAGTPARAVFRKFGFADREVVCHDGRPMAVMARPPSDEKRGGSFHYRYPEFIREARAEFCPVCGGKAGPDGQDEITRIDNCFVMAEYPGQARLFGKMYVMPERHAVHFEDMGEDEALRFMRVVRQTGSALREVTRAEKINYEMHANSGAHLHIHLFPRYLDDDFPGAPIDYRLTDPPYESRAEYLWFIERMREALARS
jgi:diadenosine tetraphosphate (Ap4A) HIT family hydrolase/GNAT superfamily N-acetyltransferase